LGVSIIRDFYVRFFRYEPTTVARLKKFIQTNRDLATIMFENFDREALESVFKIADKKKSGFRKCKTLVDLEQFLARLDANHSIETKYDQLPTDYKQRITKAENDLKFAFDEDHVAALQKRLDDLWREADRWLVDQSRKNMVRRNVCVGVF
jgi:DNA repair ATPase RecN